MVRCLTPFGMTGLRGVRRKEKEKLRSHFHFSFFFLPQMHVFSSGARNLFMNLPPHIIKKYLAVTVFYFELPPTIISKW